MTGLVNLFKPRGWTSRDAVNKVRNLLGVKAAGHMGTLDPQGDGVLVIGVGKATRLFGVMLEKDKAYSADFAFGYETDTLDGDGTVTSLGRPIPKAADIERVLPAFVGRIDQLPPAYSAKNVNGARAYDLARRGMTFELRPASVEIRSIKLTADKGDGVFSFEIECSAGTYIRSICRDLAAALGTAATMTAIRRLRSGNFRVEDSVTIEDVARLKERAVMPLETALASFPRLDLPDETFATLINGVKPLVANPPPAPFTVFCRGELFGLGETDSEGRLTIKTYLRE